MQGHYLIRSLVLPALACSTAAAQEWHVDALAGVPSESPFCCDSVAQAFVPGGPAVGSSGSGQTSIGSYVVAWPDAAMPATALDGGPYEICRVVDANQVGDLAVEVSICPQRNGACPAVARLVGLDGTIEEVGDFGGSFLHVRAINALGTMVGEVDPPGPIYRSGWVYDTDGGRLLPMPENATHASVVDVGDDNEIIGWAYESGVSGRTPTVWINDAPTVLPTLGASGEATAIDANGVIYGICALDGQDVAVRWVNGEVSQLPMPAGGVSSEVTVVSRGGVVAGIYHTATDFDPVIFVVDLDGGVATLGPLPEDIAFLDLVGVSDEGVVAGTVVYGPKYLSEAFVVGGDAGFQTASSIAPDIFALGTTTMMALDGERMLIRAWGQSSYQSWLVTPAALAGDLNGDGAVNAADLGLLLAAWGACAECAGDLNGDGSVNAADLGLLLVAWS